VQLLGGRVVDHTAKWGGITHFVCVNPELVDSKQYESACKRKKPMVTVKWLFDCYDTHCLQPEERYFIKSVQAVPDSPVASQETPVAKQRSFAVLASYDVFISPASLGSDQKLPERAEELGAKVHTWRNVDELRAALAACGVTPPGDAHAGNMPPCLVTRSDGHVGTAAAGSGCNDHNVVVLFEKEEVGSTDSSLASFTVALRPVQRGMFVLPTWLSETYSQRRCLPLESFAALPATDADGQATKRQRTSEATYAWQSEASARLDELAEDSRAAALRCKQQQKVSEGLRLANLHREGPASART
jgi:hypothetical protein